MANELVRRSKYASTELAKDDEFDVIEFAQRSGKMGEIALIADKEMTDIADYAIGSLGDLTIRAASTSRLLSEAGVRSDVFNEGALMVLQVTRKNVGVLTNAGQQAIIEEAVSRFR